MKKILLKSLFALLGLIALAGGLFAYFLYTPDPDVPQLSGVLTKATIQVDGKEMTYRTYLPKGLAKNAALVIVMHGSAQNGSQIRLETGYGFDRLADQYGFGVVYPSASSFDWNDCIRTCALEKRKQNRSGTCDYLWWRTRHAATILETPALSWPIAYGPKWS